MNEVADAVTFLFTDIASSTALWDGEPLAMSEALKVHDDVLRAAIAGQRGSVFSTAGDGVGAVFGSATDWDDIAELVTDSYRLTAPKKLVAQLDASDRRIGNE